jgi:hypothetical protein
MKKVKIIKMTKEFVDSLLASNENNRAIRPRVVATYLRDIKKGDWHFTHQGIGIYEDGTLADGQHRLEALRQAGYPDVEMVVVWGLSKKAVNAIDQHAKRSIIDIFNFAFQERVNRHVPAAARIVYSLKNSWSHNASPSEIYEIAADLRDVMNEIIQHPSHYKTFPSSVLGAFIWVASKMGASSNAIDGIKKFMTQVESGELLTKEMPAFHLRNYLNSFRGVNTQTLQKERVAKTIKATEAFLDNKQMKVLKA